MHSELVDFKSTVSFVLSKVTPHISTDFTSTISYNTMSTMSQPDTPFQAEEEFQQQGASNSSQRSCPLYGSLNARDPRYYIISTEENFRLIISSAPTHLKERLYVDVDKDILISEALQLRYEEGIDVFISTKSPQMWLKKLISMHDNLLRSMASFNPSCLRAMVKSAFQADVTLQPRSIPITSQDLLITVLTWKVRAKAKANASVVTD